MSPVDRILAQGIAAARTGEKGTARRLLSQAVQQNPDSETAWLWLSGVLDTPQARIFCLHRVLALNPDNEAARRGLAALSSAAPGPVLVAGTPPSPAPTAVTHPPATGRRTRFWQVTVACLGVVALLLVGLLVYAAIGGSFASGDELVAAAALPPSPTLGPQGTLRPTFTPTPTDTPTPTPTDTPTATPTDTPIPTSTDTPTATPTPTFTPRPRRRSATATPTPAPTARPTLPPRTWDPRLTDLGVRVEPAFVGPGKPYWRLVAARWSDERQAAGKHSIYVDVLNAQGERALGQMVVVQWSDGSVALPVENRPAPDWPMNFGMYNTLGSYAVSVSGAPSDRIVGLGLGTADAPAFTIHTCFYLTFRLVSR